MNPNSQIIKIILFFLLIINIYSYYTTIRANDLSSYCEKNIYKIIIDVDIGNPLQEYINFYMTMKSKKNLLFKCIIDAHKNKIICVTNLASHKIELNKGDEITLPYPFPEIKDVVWEYHSFLYNIYRRTIYLKEGCGESVVKNNITKLNVTKWDLITKVNKIYNGQCLLSDRKDNFYSFNMNLNIIGGKLKESLEEDDAEINFLQEIIMPFTISPLSSFKNSNNFQVHVYYKFAFCSPLDNINSTNYLKEDGIDFICNIPISDQYILNGPIKINTFSDIVYSRIYDEDKPDFISMYLTTDQNPRLKDDSILEEEEEEGEEEGEEEEGENNMEEYNENNDEKKINKSFKNNNNVPISSQSQIVSTESSITQSSTVQSSSAKPSSAQPSSVQSSSVQSSSVKSSSALPSSVKSSSVKSSSALPLPVQSSSAKPSSVQPSSVQSPSVKSSSAQSSPVKSSSAKPSLIQSSSVKTSSAPFSSPVQSSALIPPSLSVSNLRRLQTKVDKKKKKSYLLLDNRKSNFICPDKPIFEITNIIDGIKYEPVIENDDKFNIILTGHLKNGYKVLSKKIIPLEFTQKEINFNLSITNNLIEETSEKKRKILCYLSSGTMFLEREIAQIKCTGDKQLQKNNKIADLTLNWLSKENIYLNDIVIKWPKDLKVNSKKLYSYDINALSINKEDYDCYDDKYYFYINIYDLKSEPEISFDLQMLNPFYSTAKCKLYTSSLLKCYLDLRKRRISKGTRIRIPMPGNYNITTFEGNYINFTVLNFTDGNGTIYADDGIATDEACGNNKYVGAIQNIGYGYAASVAIIILILAIVILIFIGIMYCTVYEITNRNKRGKYFSHTDEKREVKNTSSINTMSPQ